MAKETELKGTDQVVFESGFKARIMGIDGTWWRECYIEVISQSGAKITVEGSVENLKLNEFFLMLSTVGSAIVPSPDALSTTTTSAPVLSAASRHAPISASEK